jgi:hypothetical protein
MVKPKEIHALTTPVKLYHRHLNWISGAPESVYIEADDPIVFCSFKTFGGTESVVNGQIINISTATLTTWYRQDIQSPDRITLLADNSEWEIIGDPENYEMRNQYMQLRLRKLSRGV